MNKTAIRNFATWARVTLKEEMQQKASRLGITPNCIQKPLPSSTSEVLYFELGAAAPLAVEGKAIAARKQIEKRLLQDKAIPYGTAYQALMEEMASTWFNRLAAIRYMEINDYFPDHMRILSSEVKDKVDPDLVSRPFDSDLEFTTEEKAQILAWKEKNQNDALFTFLLGKRCRELAAWLPGLFDGEDEISEAFLQFSYIDPNGVVYHLVHDIPEEDFQDQVQIIGWLYQYYNSEWKDEVFANLKKNIKVSKENIPAATQLFTPDWIVRYMVENSLGRLWLSGHPDASLQAKWKYYVPEAKQEPAVEGQLQELRKEYARLKPEDLTLLDPCSGSGHILVYAFDVLMDIYQSQGYTDREAAQSILAHNLYGLDIDDRAYQLTYFALMMKARQYDRRIFARGIRPQVYAVEESNGMEKWEGEIPQNQALDLSETYRDTADYLIDTFRDAKEYGSLIPVESRDYAGLAAEIERLQQEGTDDLLLAGWLYTDGNRLIKLAKQAQVMSSRFLVSATNPPYMASGNMSPLLSAFAKKNYPVSKADLFAMFMERCGAFTREKGLQAMITQHSWMFLSSFEALRKKVQQKALVDMAHLGPRAFEEIGGEVVQVTSFVLAHCQVPGYLGTYCRLLEPTTQDGKEKMFLEGKNRYTAKQENFAKIPGELVAYWISEKMISHFSGRLLGSILTTREGMATANNDLFLRLWYEVSETKIGWGKKNITEALESNMKWFPYNKGGDYRKWYGNNDYLVNWANDGYEIKHNIDLGTGRIRSHNYNGDFAFRKGITWSALSVSKISVRYVSNGFLFDSKGAKGFADSNEDNYFSSGLINSIVGQSYLAFIAPTVDFKVGDIIQIPLVIKDKEEIVTEVQENISLSKSDWDSFETSWDFQGHPLVPKGMSDLMTVMLGESTGVTLEERYLDFQAACEDRFIVLQENEEKLNRIFIDLYGLQDELTPEVADKDITVHKVFDRKEDIPASMVGSNYVLTKEDVMKSLLSYAVGCLFGRYSLDTPGLAYAGGEWDAGKYKNFIPDDDNVLPITDEEYFDDDLPSFICGWLKKAFGRENFEDNLEFLTDALGTRGATPKEKLRNYFLKDFYKDHCRTYQKRPIYWLFDSGKENGFKALVYIHRWNQDTEGRVLLYLHKVQRKYETELRMLEQELDSLMDKHRIGQLEKRREHLEKQLAEVKAYDEKLDHMASEHLVMDLDDGVKVNYEKMQTDREGIRYPILAKIK